MRKSGKCPKCGGTDIIVDARMVDRDTNSFKRDLLAATYDNPEALFFKGEHLFSLSACICRSCWYTELCAHPES